LLSLTALHTGSLSIIDDLATSVLRIGTTAEMGQNSRSPDRVATDAVGPKAVD
jgi:hypothetical protein